ncbi:putative O-linked N-acetylglucosamine transferase (SPINDLY family) [Paucibacter oligotrophus]|uniref:protein O-GlcNAc transferase n=1 Tax=Roseateles oligotrophus TaxID=1769250 RepID=A0A840L7L8_9BURK|nr:acetylglucosamine transferase [Roseateles oligotrophus]MBB4844056.1 putative O-linked N-acetylglucosamine transferase (SPINDLY family) [Roseateles oligotrophus]
MASLLRLAGSGEMAFEALIQHASLLERAGLAEAAALLYQTWLMHSKSAYLHVACYNWGALLGGLNKHKEAEHAYRLALSLTPGFAQAKLNLGHQLEHQGRIDEALAEWLAVADAAQPPSLGQSGLELRLHGLNNAARMLETAKRYAESQALMQRSLALNPAQGDVIQHYIHIRQKQCDWPIYQTVGEVTQNQLLVNTSLLATLSATDDPAVQLLVAQRFVNEKVQAQAHKGAPLHAEAPARQARQGRIKIGYLSGDLCMHAVGLLTAELFELHDKARFETYAFCWSREDGSPLRARILQAMDHHVRLKGVDDHTAARLIAEAGIDILVDLQGLTSGARPNILTYRAAPIQVSYLGLPATSAVPGVDWMLADRFVMPPEYLPYCSEKPIYLPHCYQVSDRQRVAGAMPTRQACGLPEEGFVFCSFNNNHKFSEEMFASWMRVLVQVPGSVLWLLADNEWAQANMLRVAAAHGVEAGRLVFAPRALPPDYLARFALADLFLDTFPYNAGTTASDCLWMGTPILTRAGRSYISRMAGSLLSAVGLPDLITHSLAEYERLAVQIGRNPARAASYKRYLAEQGRGSALFDMPAIVKAMESEFERLAMAQRARDAV